MVLSIAQIANFAQGHCYLMTENLQKAYDAYQQALVNLRDPKVRLYITIAKVMPTDVSSGSHVVVWNWYII